MIRQVPTGDFLFLTANKAEKTPGGILLLDDAQVLLEQEVIGVGCFVKEIQVGDLVTINLDKFKKKVPKNSKVAKDPSQPDLMDTLVGYDDMIEIPVYDMDGYEVIVINQYDIMPWRVPNKVVEKIDKSKIVTNIKLN